MYYYRSSLKISYTTSNASFCQTKKKQPYICSSLTVRLGGKQKLCTDDYTGWLGADYLQITPITLQLSSNIFFLLSQEKWEIQPGSRTRKRCDSPRVGKPDLIHHLILYCYELMARYDNVLVALVQRPDIKGARNESSFCLVVTVLRRIQWDGENQNTCQKNRCLLWYGLMLAKYQHLSQCLMQHTVRYITVTVLIILSAVYCHQILSSVALS